MEGYLMKAPLIQVDRMRYNGDETKNAGHGIQKWEVLQVIAILMVGNCSKTSWRVVLNESAESTWGICETHVSFVVVCQIGHLITDYY